MKENYNIKFNTTPMTALDGLALLFIGLKLTNNISWSWGWVLSPIWIPLVAVVILSTISTILKKDK